jgi:hypothetical protein
MSPLGVGAWRGKALAVSMAAGSLIAQPRPALAQSATSADAAASSAETRALDDYLALRIGQAAQRLESAIRQCGDAACSPRVRAHLHLTLGFVYGAGAKDLKGARDEFAEALRIDRSLSLDPGMRSREVSRAFRDAQDNGGGASAPPPPPQTGPSEEAGRTDSLFAPPIARVVAEDSSPSYSAPSETRHAALDARDSLALYAEADLAALVPLRNVCSPGGPANWVCFNPDGSRYSGTPQPHLDNNDIRAGLGLSTLRLVAAYDHGFGARWSIGLRLGFALNGGPTPPGGSGFMPVHAEARMTYQIDSGRAPVVPFGFVSGGLEEVDTRVNVLVVEIPCATAGPQCAITLAAWRRAGYAFFATGGGARLAIGKHGALAGDLRVGFTFPSVAAVLTPELGYAYTF